MGAPKLDSQKIALINFLYDHINTEPGNPILLQNIMDAIGADDPQEANRLLNRECKGVLVFDRKHKNYQFDFEGLGGFKKAVDQIRFLRDSSIGRTEMDNRTTDLEKDKSTHIHRASFIER